MRSRYLVALVIVADVAIAAGGAPLEAFSLRSAFDPGSSALLILGLLAANVILLGIVALAFASSSVLFWRLAQRVVKR